MATQITSNDINSAQLRLAKALEQSNKQQASWIRPIWQGALLGIGSTVGLALALYILSLIIKPLQYVPILGGLIRDQIQPAIDQKVSPTSTNTTTPTSTQSTTQSTTTSTGKSSISNNYFAVTLPGSWSIKLNQTSSGSDLVRFQADTQDYKASSTGATVSIVVSKQAATTTEESLIATDTVTVDGVSGAERRFKLTSSGSAEGIDLHLAKNGSFYMIRLEFNPDTLNGQQTFRQLLDSFTFRT